MNKYKKLIVILFLLLTTQSIAQEKKEFKPRFASMTSSLINLRTGPGMQYPIDWVYKKRDYPVEIIEDYDTWRKIKDIDGTVGWIHQGMLSSRRYGIVTKKSNLTRKKDAGSQTLAVIEPKVEVKIIACPKNTQMCRVEVKGKHGFINRNNLWGLFPEEFF